MGCGETNTYRLKRTHRLEHTDTNAHMLRLFIEVKVIICTDQVLLLNVPLSFGITILSVFCFATGF